MAMIEAKKIEGAAVYGVEQVSYTVDGVGGQDYTYALTVACFKQAAAVEANLDAVTTLARARQTKLKDLNQVLVILTLASGTLPVEDQVSTDLSSELESLRDAVDIARKYGILFGLAGANRNQMQRDELQRTVSNVKYAVDMENNSLQQDIVSMQNLIEKRDSTYGTASSIVKRSQNASFTTIKSIGR